ncbi:MAG: polysaccharide biosynthesis tyrosine autokinase [Planctomyces sp.]
MSTVSAENQISIPQTEDNSGGLDLLGFLRRRKSFIILFAGLGTGVGYMLLQRQVPQYRSEAMVQVIHRAGDARVRSMMAEKDLTDANYVLRSERTLQAAWKNHSLNSRPSLSGLSEEEAINRLSSMLSVTPRSANVLTIAATGSNPEDIRDIANAAAEEYVATQKENYQDASEEVKVILSRARDELHEQLKSAEQEYAKFREGSNLTTDGENPNRIRARAAESRVSAYEHEKTVMRAELNALVEAVEKGGAREAILMLIGKQDGTNTSAVGKVAGDPTAQAIFPLMLEEAQLATELGPGHPKLKIIQMKMQMIRDHMKQMAGLDSAVENEEKQTDFLTLYLRSLEQQLQIIERQQQEVQVLASNDDALARKLMLEEIEDKHKKANIDRLGLLFNNTSQAISEVHMNAGMGGVTALVLQHARTGIKISPIMERFLGMGALLGAMAGLGIAYLIEMADRSFRKPEDIIREFGVPIMGHIPFMTEQRMKISGDGNKLDRSAITVHLPRSRPAEAFRAIRTAVCFSAMAGEHRVISVTSPAAGDGKSTLALNLAVSLAQSGKRTVLLESDLRRPKVHKLTGVENKVGVVDVLRGTSEIESAVQTTQVPDLFIIPCGSRPKDPAELLARPEYETLLEDLRSRFDYVIVDTPPILAVTDPAGVAARVDGVIVCMRLSRHTRDLGKRTIDSLRDIGATVSGVVINGVEERDAYGYGNYRYSDYRYYYKSYNYKYGYGYGRYGSYNSYTSKDGSEYFPDENQTGGVATAGSAQLQAIASKSESAEEGDKA